MLGKTHMVAGALAWTAAAPIAAPLVGLELGVTELLIGIPLATFAALLPDIDHPDALLTRGWIPFTRFLGFLGKPIGFLVSIPPRIVGMMARSVMGHRGGTHSLLFAALWTFGFLPLYGLLAAGLAWLLGTVLASTPLAFDPAWLFNWEMTHLGVIYAFVALAVALGYLSHLATDSLNTVPVPWLWPFTKRRFFFLPPGLRIRVESLAEWLFRVLLILALIAALWLVVGAPLLHQAERTLGENAAVMPQDPPA